MRELLYLSTKKLGTFLPDWPSLSVRGTASVGVGPVSVTVDVSTLRQPDSTRRPSRHSVGCMDTSNAKQVTSRPGSGGRALDFLRRQDGIRNALPRYRGRALGG